MFVYVIVLWLLFVVCLSGSLVWFVRAALLCSCVCVLRLVCMCYLWCVVLLCAVSLVCRACMWCCCVVVGFVFCYGVNAFLVCDRNEYVPYVRCSSMFV